jgi:LysM repeat protein
MNLRQLLSFITCFAAFGTATAADAEQFHVVDAGDTLWDISRSYGCEVEALREENGLKDDRLPIGRRLEIPGQGTPQTPKQEKPEQVAIVSNAEVKSAPRTLKTPKAVKGLVKHEIANGETLGAIAVSYGTSVEDLVARNSLSGTEIFAGDTLRILPSTDDAEKQAVVAQSIGATNRGHLRNASRLKSGPGYFIRRPERSYGAEFTIKHVRRAVAHVRKRHAKTHRLAVGDISAKRGGKISMHASHQSGRDIDLGFYFKKQPKGYPQSFADVTASNLNFDASWTLLMSFVDSVGKPGGAEKVFISYETQKVLYKQARKRRISKGKLAGILQYPHGRASKRALVRHEPGHNEHMHVRFACPPNAERCK